jgi:probable HAF family extracellular repeat protein
MRHVRRAVHVLALSIIALPLSLAPLTSASAAEPDCFPLTDRWRATVLDIQRAVASDINNRGQITGTIRTLYTGPDRPFIWQEGQATYLETPTEDGGTAAAIDDDGRVTGNVWAPPGGALFNAAVWPAGPSIRDLGALGGRSAFPHSIDAGHVTGTIAGDRDQAFHWRDGTLTRLPVSGNSTAAAVNKHGVIAGTQNIRKDFPRSWERREHAFVYANGRVTDLGTLGEGLWSEAIAINDHGQVLGQAPLEAHGIAWDGFVWSPETGMKIIDGGAGVAAPVDINNNGMLVGSYACTNVYGDYGPAVWLNPDSAPVRLPVPDGFTSSNAVAVNDSGVIVGSAAKYGEAYSVRAIIWQPVQ